MSPASAGGYRPPRKPSATRSRSGAPYRRRGTAKAVQEPIVHDGLAVWTDGACSPNPGPGGYGWVEVRDGEATGLSGSGSEEKSSNQRMEIAAALDALRTVTERPITVYTDSRYVADCFGKKWWAGWMKNGWMNSQRQPVANTDLWKPLIKLVVGDGTEPQGVRFQWVKAHVGHEFNEQADQMAVAARLGIHRPHW